jgi:hypothetical protein
MHYERFCAVHEDACGRSTGPYNLPPGSSLVPEGADQHGGRFCRAARILLVATS